MFLIAVVVMIGKSFYVRRTDKANQIFLRRFRDTEDVLALGARQPGNSKAPRCTGCIAPA